jgi:hypothetical protein
LVFKLPPHASPAGGTRAEFMCVCACAGLLVARAGFKSPLSFLELFRHGRQLGLMSASCGLACFADGGNLNDIEQMWIANDVTDMVCEHSSSAHRGRRAQVVVTQSPPCLPACLPACGATPLLLSQGLRANSIYLSMWGLCGSAGGLFVPLVLPLLGKRLYASATTFTNFLACVMWGAVPRAWAMFLGLGLHFPGINANSSLPLKTQATELAIAAGLGRGEFAGYFGNLRALTVSVGPFIMVSTGQRSPSSIDKAPRSPNLLTIN